MAWRSLWLVWVAAAVVGDCASARASPAGLSKAAAAAAAEVAAVTNTVLPPGDGAASYAVAPTAGTAAAASAAAIKGGGSFGVVPHAGSTKKPTTSVKAKVNIPKAKQKRSCSSCGRQPPPAPTLQKTPRVASTCDAVTITLNYAPGATCYTVLLLADLCSSAPLCSHAYPISQLTPPCSLLADACCRSCAPMCGWPTSMCSLLAQGRWSLQPAGSRLRPTTRERS